MMPQKLDHEKGAIPFDIRRAATLAVMLAVAAVLLYARERPAFVYLLERTSQLLLAALVCVVVLGVAALAGLALLPREMVRRLTRTECLLFGTLAALAIFSCGTLILGLLGMLTPMTAKGFLLAAGIWGLWRWWRTRPLEAQRASWISEPWTKKQNVLLAFLAVALIPIITSAFAPPLLYDVTEYHLGAFRDYFREGVLRFRPMPHNFYARFPFPVEALYYLGLLLESPNDFAPKLLNLASVFGLVALSWQWLGRWGVRRLYRLLAALAILCHPVLLEVSLDAYIDAPVALFVLATLYGLEIALAGASENGTASPGRRLLPVAAWIAGTACVTKYTAAQLYAVPIAVVFALPLWKMRRLLSAREMLLAAFCFLLPVIVWLGKNVFLYGNPLEPFFAWFFAPGDAAAVAREKFYIESHYPQPPWTLAYWTTLVPRLDAIGWFFLAPLVALPLIFRRPSVQRAFAVCVGSYLLWNFIRYSQDRFLLATIILVIMLSVAVLNELPTALGRSVGASALLMGAMCGFLPHVVRVAGGGEFEYLGEFVSMPSERHRAQRLAFYEKNLGALGELVSKVEKSLPRNANILLLYEARPYLFTHHTVYNTVFDESELLRLARGAQSADEITSRLREAGISHVLVNMEELRRFIDQYARPEQLRMRGIRHVMTDFPLIRDPEDLYPPFHRSPDWPRLREPILAWLRDIRLRALFTCGHGAAPVFLAPLVSSEKH